MLGNRLLRCMRLCSLNWYIYSIYIKITVVSQFGSFNLETQTRVNKQVYYQLRQQSHVVVVECRRRWDLDHLEYLHHLKKVQSRAMDLIIIVAGAESLQMIPSKGFNLQLFQSSVWVHSCITFGQSFTFPHNDPLVAGSSQTRTSLGVPLSSPKVGHADVCVSKYLPLVSASWN